MRKRAKYHWFNIQRNDLTVKDITGALDRREGWRTTNTNIPCQIQQINRGEAFEKYNISVAEVLYIILFHNVNFTPDASYRFIIPSDGLETIQLPDTLVLGNYKILEFKGFNKSAIGKLKRKGQLEVYGEHNKRWTL